MINRDRLLDFARRKVGDVGSRRMWTDEFLVHAIESAVIETVTVLPQGFTKIIDLPTNQDNQTVDLPDKGVVFTRAYGEVVDGKIGRTLRWTSETRITESDACWREKTGAPTHLVYTEDQERIWLNGLSSNPIRCSVAMIPDPIISAVGGSDPVVQVRDAYFNALLYHMLSSMYSLPTNGQPKKDSYYAMFLQTLGAKQAGSSLNPANLAQSE